MVSIPRRISPLLSAVHNSAPRLQPSGCGALGLPSTRVRGLPAPSRSIKLQIKSITSFFQLRLYTSQTSALRAIASTSATAIHHCRYVAGADNYGNIHNCRPPPTLKLVRVAGYYGFCRSHLTMLSHTSACGAYHAPWSPTQPYGVCAEDERSRACQGASIHNERVAAPGRLSHRRYYQPAEHTMLPGWWRLLTNSFTIKILILL